MAARQKKSRTQKPRNKQATSLAPLQDRLRLKAVRLLELHALLNISAGKVPSPDMGIHAQSNFGANPEEKTVIGNLKVTVVPQGTEAPAEGVAPDSSVTFVVVMQCVFNVDVAPEIPTLPKDEIAAVNNLITMSAWPYVRQHISSLTAQMGIPPVTLPLMRLVVPSSGELKLD